MAEKKPKSKRTALDRVAGADLWDYPEKDRLAKHISATAKDFAARLGKGKAKK